MKRTEAQIGEMINRGYDLRDSGENPYFGMTFADGVREALRWAIGEQDEEPLSPTKGD